MLRRRGTVALLAAALVLAACSRDSPAPPRASGRAECAPGASDSARVVCAALDTAQALVGAPVRTLDVSARGPHWCVVTVPSTPATVDGMAAVVVDSAGRVVSAAAGDSIGCPGA